ncbi:hypothetical protein Q7C36_017187 [Tachysurus vachellii]|uniref:Uncharacterized protein n=1 Tax=Tachysurus vachellii TaxID=175792 RepID=A0AA88M297_TACVA|nr:hypothetical protein Q7C36_017187 [Tachysurus vachellii]
MPEEVQLAIANGKRPAPDKQRQMTCILYPSSFADMMPGGVIIGGGFTSLLSQVKTRIENVNRAGTLKQHRTSRLSGQLRRPSDSYGCKQFNPELPLEETHDTLEQKRQQLGNIYRQEGIHSGEKAEVINLMKTTFCLQHNKINETPAPSIQNLRIQWPYLFTQNISVLSALELSLKDCGQGIVKYLMTKAKNKPVISEGEDAELTFIQLLMAYFDERIEGLILCADISATAVDVEHILTLPASPRLILLEKALSPIDFKRVKGTVKKLVSEERRLRDGI